MHGARFCSIKCTYLTCGVNEKDSETALMLASQNGHLMVVQLLLELVVDLNGIDSVLLCVMLDLTCECVSSRAGKLP